MIAMNDDESDDDKYDDDDHELISMMMMMSLVECLASVTHSSTACMLSSDPFNSDPR